MSALEIKKAVGIHMNPPKLVKMAASVLRHLMSNAVYQKVFFRTLLKLFWFLHSFKVLLKKLCIEFYVSFLTTFSKMYTIVAKKLIDTVIRVSPIPPRTG